MSAILAAFINAGIAGAAVTILVWAALFLAPRRMLNAATRYAVWWVALLIIVLLPAFYLPHGADPVSTLAPSVAAEIAVNTETSAHEISTPLLSDAPVAYRGPRFPLEIAAGRWQIGIFFAWGFAIVLMLVRLAASYVVLERRKRRARPADNLRQWSVRALISSEINSPMAAGLYRPAILLPERLLAELSEDELDQIRVHETAHLIRRDDIALLLQRMIEALFAFHPVVRWITRRIDLEREIACDDFVLEQTGGARPYASCLTRIAEIAGGVRSSIVAAAAAEESSHLARRIEMLLNKTRHKGTRLLKVRLLLITAALTVLACLVARAPGVIAFAAAEENPFSYQAPSAPEAPAAPQAPNAPEAPNAPNAPLTPEAPRVPDTPNAPDAPAAPEVPQVESHHNRNIESTTKEGLHSTRVRLHGDVQFTDDETDVKAVSADGYFSYEESFGFSSRRFEARANSSGQITRRYLVDGQEKSFDADAKAWLRAALPDLLRESAIDAPERVRRIFKQGGAPAVLAEIGKIHSDGAKRVYIRELVPIGNLSTDQFQTLLRIVRGINSDGEKASALVFLAPYTLKDNLRDHTFEALATIHSDGEKHRVLTQFISQDSSRATLVLAARAASGINSDGEKAAVLVDLASHLRGNDDLRRPFFRAAETIHSDGEHARVLMAVIASAGEQHDTLVEALHNAELISSDGEKARVLTHADGYWKDDDSMRRAYFETTRTIHSDGEKARVLTSLVGRPGLSNRTLIDAVHCATGINSDGEKARVLVAIASHSNGKSEVRDEIKTAASSIHSDGEYRRVMNAVDLRASNVANRP